MSAGAVDDDTAADVDALVADTQATLATCAARFVRSASNSPPAELAQQPSYRRAETRHVDWPVVIRLDNVSKIYPAGARPALDCVSMDIAKGEFVFLIGASGSGKTTVLRLLLREEVADQGVVTVNGRNLNRLAKRKVPDLRRKIGCVFQDFRLLPKKTVYENVSFALEVINKSPKAIKRTVPEVLDLVGLTGKARRLPHELSGGEQQRVAIARAFVNRPLVLLADEPTGNLDPDTSQGIMSLLERINRTGTTVVMATHDNNIVDAMRRRVIELEFGKVIRDQARGVYGVGR
jgi:cell division transport system ATP-binding protein